MLNHWDYIAIGTLGFAQVGRPDYEQRIVAEKAIINAFYNTHDVLKVPDDFRFVANFKWELCPHDFGFYWDFQLAYDRWWIEELEESEEEDEQERFTQFWDWVHQCEQALCENEERLLEWCELLYQKDITMTIVHKRIDEIQHGLKIA